MSDLCLSYSVKTGTETKLFILLAWVLHEKLITSVQSASQPCSRWPSILISVRFSTALTSFPLRHKAIKRSSFEKLLSAASSVQCHVIVARWERLSVAYQRKVQQSKLKAGESEIQKVYRRSMEIKCFWRLTCRTCRRGFVEKRKTVLFVVEFVAEFGFVADCKQCRVLFQVFGVRHS